MTTDLRALHEQLKHEWCDTFAVSSLPDGSLTISTPFLFGDGDGYPVIIERHQRGWRITDRGVAASRLQLVEMELTEAREQQMLRMAEASGCTVEAGVLSLVLDDDPTAEDVADFIQVVAQVTGIPLHVAPERESDQFRTRARDVIVSWLPRGYAAVSNWRPSVPKGAHFSADLFVPTSAQGVASFFAGSDQKAYRSMVSIGQYRLWQLDVKSLLVHNGSLSSETIYRAQTALEDDQAVIAVNERAEATGYMTLHRTLHKLGAPVR